MGSIAKFTKSGKQLRVWSNPTRNHSYTNICMLKDGTALITEYTSTAMPATFYFRHVQLKGTVLPITLREIGSATLSSANIFTNRKYVIVNCDNIGQINSPHWFKVYDWVGNNVYTNTQPTFGHTNNLYGTFWDGKQIFELSLYGASDLRFTTYTGNYVIVKQRIVSNTDTFAGMAFDGKNFYIHTYSFIFGSLLKLFNREGVLLKSLQLAAPVPTSYKGMATDGKYIYICK